MNFTHRLLFLIGTGVVGWVVFFAWLVGGGGDTDDRVQETGQPEQVGTVEQTSVPDQSAAADPGGGAEAGVAAADDEPGGDADMVQELSAEACARFEQGQTVAEFAAWFEDQYPGSEDEVAAMFRAVVARALQEECPEVIPDS